MFVVWWKDSYFHRNTDYICINQISLVRETLGKLTENTQMYVFNKYKAQCHNYIIYLTGKICQS